MWEDAEVTAAVRGFIWNGGGFIGVGEPSGHQYQGRYLQLAGALGVEKETGFTLNYDKYNWEEHPGHFILADCGGDVDLSLIHIFSASVRQISTAASAAVVASGV